MYLYIPEIILFKRMDIKFEIEKAQKIEILNDNDLQSVKELYFSKDGILPKIYNFATTKKGEESSLILSDLNKIRSIIIKKISDYTS